MAGSFGTNVYQIKGDNVGGAYSTLLGNEKTIQHFKGNTRMKETI
jgi:hypothetical protein